MFKYPKLTVVLRTKGFSLHCNFEGFSFKGLPFHFNFDTYVIQTNVQIKPRLTVMFAMMKSMIM